MVDVIIYGRIVTKREFKLIRKTKQLLGEELIPAFDATPVLDRLELSKDQIKELGILFGGGGENTYLVLFKTKSDPVVKDIPFRDADKIRKLLGKNVKEVKFKSGTQIEIIH